MVSCAEPEEIAPLHLDQTLGVFFYVE